MFLPYNPVLSAANAELEETDPLCSARIAINTIGSADISVANCCLKHILRQGLMIIPPFIIKDCLEIFRKPLLRIYNLALQTATYPAEWKILRVTPIPKGSSRSKVENYRRISGLSSFGKVIINHILNHYMRRQVKTQLAECQHGFRAGKSTVTNHINFVDLTVIEMEKKQVDVAYFDFKKALDRVQNDVLFKKLSIRSCCNSSRVISQIGRSVCSNLWT